MKQLINQCILLGEMDFSSTNFISLQEKLDRTISKFQYLLILRKGIEQKIDEYSQLVNELSEDVNLLEREIETKN